MTSTSHKQMETPSGKGAGDENFPVGSFLLPRRFRPHVAKYYAFARGIDDIADNPALAPKDKVLRLDGFQGAILGKTKDKAFQKAIDLRHSMLETSVDLAHALDLISAFKQDAVKLRYQTWGELIDYCNRSAAPVGRYLLELHGEDRQAFKYSDALCNAVQVINHLQDCKDDYLALDRVYIPQDWLKENGAKTKDIKGGHSTPELLQTLHQCIEGSLDLMEDARRLPGALKSTSLAMESAVIVRIAERLLELLAEQDPVAGRVELTKPQFLWCGAKGALAGLFRARG